MTMYPSRTAQERLAARLEGRRLAPIASPAEALDPSATRGRKWSGSLVAICALGIYLFLKMIYLWDDGLPQPGDLVIGVLAIVIVKPRLARVFMKQEIALAALVIWITLVNITWYLVLNNPQFLIFTSYYYFNLLILLTTFTAYHTNKEGFERWLPRFIYASVIFQTGYVIVQGAARANGTFLNANQLAYWSITVITLLLVIRRNKIVVTDLFIILAGLYCAIASVSRAGLGGLAILLVIWSWFALKTPLKRLVGGLAAVLLVLGAMAGGLSSQLDNFTGVEKYEQRQAKKARTSLSEERNLDRLVDYYAYTALGAGEGAYGRFEDNPQYALEIHSTVATMLFSYGLLGLGAFLALVISLFMRLPLSIAIYQIPSLIYGLTHNGIRFSFFWVVIGLMMAIAWERREQMGKALGALGAGDDSRPSSDDFRAPVQRDASFLRRLAVRD